MKKRVKIDPKKIGQKRAKNGQKRPPLKKGQKRAILAIFDPPKKGGQKKGVLHEGAQERVFWGVRK